MRTDIVSYAGLMFRPFFSYWWAVITGAASLLGLLLTPKSGLTVTGPMVLIAVLAFMTLGFLLLSTIVQSWSLFRSRAPYLRIIGVHKNKEFGGDFVVILDCETELAKGMIVELKRHIGGVDVPFAVVEVGDLTSRGNIQAIPIWAASAHQRDFFQGKFVAADLTASPFLQADTFRRIKEAP